MLHRATRLWRNFFDQRRLDQDLDDELRSYQDLLADEKRELVGPADHRRQAVVEMVGIEQIKEQVGRFAALVNETFAKLHWPGQNPLSKRIRKPGGEQSWISIVGVIADVKDYGLDQPTRPSVYLPWALHGNNFFAVVVRTTVDPTSLTNAIREDLRHLDPDLSMIRPTTMSQRLHESMWLRRTYSWLVGVFAALAVVLVVSGLYGVISYTVNQRRRELAIRAALGADQGRLLRGVLLETLLMTGIGLSIGLVCGWWSSRLFASLLFGVQATDPATYLVASAIAGSVALAAGLLPAVRVSRLNPVTVLRMD